MDAVIAAINAQDVYFQTEKELNIGYHMSEATTTTMKPFSLNWNPVFESMSVGQVTKYYCGTAKVLLK